LIAPRSLKEHALIETVRITKATYLICQIKVTTSTTTDPSVQWDRCFLDRQHSFATCWNSGISLHKIKTPQERTDDIDLCQIVAMLCTIFIQEKALFPGVETKNLAPYFGGPPKRSIVQQVACKEDRACSRDLLKRTRAGRDGAIDIKIVGPEAFALNCPILRILIDRGAVAPVERFAVEF
jgi:hypothetical protein